MPPLPKTASFIPGTGATGGLGQATARLLAERGAQLIVSGRRADVLEPLASELDGRAVEADLSQAADVERLLDEAGDVDVLIANAALPGTGLLDSFSEEQIDRCLAVNLRAPILMARALWATLWSLGVFWVLYLLGVGLTPLAAFIGVIADSGSFNLSSSV